MLSKIKTIKSIVLNHLGKPTPVFCQWEITHSCNMNCAFCPVMKQESPWQPELTKEQALKIVDQLSKLGVTILNITGGE
ncbi:radical SAM protein, partial [Candidatus Woesearchaeota archaeon]|nr:radical SAM protein [Candidatus Woesearchaeota archaeon]